MRLIEEKEGGRPGREGGREASGREEGMGTHWGGRERGEGGGKREGEEVVYRKRRI